jgi:hypothetical protein
MNGFGKPGAWLDADAEGGRSRKPSQNGGGR